jgi:DNA-binding response OmpR family regulator
VIKPLAFLMYEELLPGSQLANRLHDLGYRVQMVDGGVGSVEAAVRDKPIVAVMELTSSTADVCGLIGELRQNPATAHVPILAYTQPENTELQVAARNAGANLIASSARILDQLPALLEHVLELE